MIQKWLHGQIQPQHHPQPHAPALDSCRGFTWEPGLFPPVPYREDLGDGWAADAQARAWLFGIPLPLPGVGYLWAEIRLHEGEVFVQLLPEDGLGEAPVGMDGVYPGHLLGHQPGRKHRCAGERWVRGSSIPPRNTLKPSLETSRGGFPESHV